MDTIHLKINLHIASPFPPKLIFEWLMISHNSTVSSHSLRSPIRRFDIYYRGRCFIGSIFWKAISSAQLNTIQSTCTLIIGFDEGRIILIGSIVYLFIFLCETLAQLSQICKFVNSYLDIVKESFPQFFGFHYALLISFCFLLLAM